MTNKEQNKNYNPSVLSEGFAEGCYSLNDEYMEGSKIHIDNRQGQNIEDMLEETENLLRNARGQ